MVYVGDIMIKGQIIKKIIVDQSKLLTCLLGITYQANAFSADLAQGKSLFEVTCAGCHAKDLSGGAGFNLKDEEWVHGNQASDILANIKRGFNDKGMPGFSGVYSDEQLTSIVDYILSKREGFENLSYKIYHIGSDASKSFDIIENLEVKKSGKLPSNLMDFDMPEVKNYIIEFEGDLYTPTGQQTNILATTKNDLFEVEIDGKIVQPSVTDWLRWAWPLKQGKQHVKIRYTTTNTRKNSNRRFPLFVANDDLTRKFFGITTPGKRLLHDATVNVKAESEELVIRKKIVRLPTNSVAVGFPEKINYAFNTKSCAIAGVWSGDLLNVGPNIEGRGKDGSLILGKWAFHTPEQIKPATDKTTQCQFIKYNRQSHTSFQYKLGSQEYSVQVLPINTTTLAFNYQLIKGTRGPLTLALPTSKGVSFSSTQGKISDNTFTVNAQVGVTYQLTLSIPENK